MMRGNLKTFTALTILLFLHLLLVAAFASAQNRFNQDLNSKNFYTRSIVLQADSTISHHCPSPIMEKIGISDFSTFRMPETIFFVLDGRTIMHGPLKLETKNVIENIDCRNINFPEESTKKEWTVVAMVVLVVAIYFGAKVDWKSIND